MLDVTIRSIKYKNLCRCPEKWKSSFSEKRTWVTTECLQ